MIHGVMGRYNLRRQKKVACTVIPHFSAVFLESENLGDQQQNASMGNYPTKLKLHSLNRSW